MRRLAILLVALAAGCGGGDEDRGDTGAAPTRTSTAVTPTDVQTVTIPDTADPNPEPSGTPTFSATLTAQSHSATAGEPWSYTVTLKKGGKPASGTAKMRVFVDDELVDTLGWFTFEGTLEQTHRWQKALRGKDVVLQAEVEGEGGTRRVNWPVSVS